MTETTVERTTALPAAIDWREAMRILIEEIRTNGHAVTGRFAGQQVLVLTTTGAKTGEPRTSPLAFSRDGTSYVVTASKGGAPTHPNWYFNLLADSTATIEVDRQTFEARASMPTGAERQRLWDQHVALHVGIGEYPKKTDRIIPIVVLDPIGPA